MGFLKEHISLSEELYDAIPGAHMVMIRFHQNLTKFSSLKESD
jgi:hypothetical protein